MASSTSSSSSGGASETTTPGNNDVEAVSDQEIDALVSIVLSANDTAALADATKQLAIWTRNVSNRERLGAREGLIAKLIELVSQQDLTDENGTSMRQHSACTIGNLAFGCVANREQITEACPAEKFVSLLESEKDAEVVINLGAAIANIVHTDGDFQVALAEAGMLPLVRRFLQHENAEVACMAARAISNLADSDVRKRMLCQSGILSELQVVASTSESERLRGQAFEAMTSILHGQAENSLEYASNGGIEALLESSRNSRFANSREHATELLVVLTASSDDIRKLFFTKKLLDGVMEYCRPGHAELSVQQSSLRLLGHLCVNNECMEYCWPSHEFVVPLLRHDDELIRLYATMTVSNLARSDTNCKALLDAGVMTDLVRQCRDSNVQAQHLAATTIRNLAIPQAHKELISRTAPDVFLALVGQLESTNPHVLWGSVYAIKVLSAGGQAICQQIVDAHGVEAVLHLYSRELGEECKKILFEAGRLIANLYLAKDEIAQHILAQEKGLEPINMMLASQFAILQAEAFRVVVKLFRSRYGRSAVAERGTAAALLLSLGAGDRSLREAVLQLLLEIATQDPSAAIALAKGGAHELLTPIAKGQDSTNAPIAQAILRALPKVSSSHHHHHHHHKTTGVGK